MQTSSDWPAKTFTKGDRDISGRFTVRPWRILPRASSSAVTHGISGSTRRGWTSSLRFALAGGFGDLLQGPSLLNAEFGYGRPPQAGQVGSDAQFLPQLVGQAANVGSRGDPAAEVHQAAIDVSDCKLFHLDFDRLKFNRLLPAGQLVGRNASDLFGREWGRNLPD